MRIIRPPPDAFGLSSATSSQGLFDLADPRSALELASFVFSLGHQFDILRRELPSRRLRILKWRADSDTVSWAESIRDWQASLDGCYQFRYVQHMVKPPGLDSHKTWLHTVPLIALKVFLPSPLPPISTFLTYPPRTTEIALASDVE